MSKSTKYLLNAAGLTALVWTSAAIAQPQSDHSPDYAQNVAVTLPAAIPEATMVADASAGGDIIVTAQKREQRLLDVPTAIAVIGSTALHESGAKDLVDVSHLTPGVIASPVSIGGRTMQTFTIRGIGNDDFRPNGNPSAAVHVDGVYQSSSALVGGQIFDVERIEILKGPQGTLYGRNTTAGALNIISRKPGDRLQGDITAEYGRYNSFRTEFGVGGPLTETVGLRVSGIYDRTDGYVTNLGSGSSAGFTLNPAIPPNPKQGIDKEAGKSEYYGGRAILTYDSHQGTALTFNLHGFRERGGQPQSERVFAISGFAPNAPYTFDVSFVPTINKRSYGASLTLVQDLTDGIFLTAIGGYEYLRQRYNASVDGVPLRTTADIDYADRLSQRSLEVRIQNRGPSVIDWTVGASAFKDKIGLLADNDVSDAFRTVIRADYRQGRKGWAGFADGTYHLADQWKLGLGVRYTKEKSDFSGTTSDLDPYGVTGAAGIFPPLPLVFARKFSDSNVSGRATLSYQPNVSTNLYVTVGRGFKAGGFDGSVSYTIPETNPFDSERVWAYEAGIKFMPRDGVLQLEAAGFYYDYSGLQANSIRAFGVVPTAVRVNVGTARVYGGELTATLRPVARLEMQISGSHINSKILAIVSDSPAETARRLGNDLPFAPSVTVSGFMRYEMPIGNGLDIVPYISGRYIADHYTELDNFMKIQGYFLATAQVEFRRKDMWSVSAWVRNLTESHYTNSLFVTGATRAQRLRGEPRTYGVSVGFSF